MDPMSAFSNRFAACSFHYTESLTHVKPIQLLLIVSSRKVSMQYFLLGRYRDLR